jgi:hypothetical protein
MWILAIIAWRRPRLAANLVLGFFTVMAVCATISGPCRMYLRAVGAPIQYDAAPVLDLIALFAGPLVLLAVAVILLERKSKP